MYVYMLYILQNYPREQCENTFAEILYPLKFKYVHY